MQKFYIKNLVEHKLTNVLQKNSETNNFRIYEKTSRQTLQNVKIFIEKEISRNVVSSITFALKGKFTAYE